MKWALITFLAVALAGLVASAACSGCAQNRSTKRDINWAVYVTTPDDSESADPNRFRNWAVSRPASRP
jgi:hypothetical protein